MPFKHQLTWIAHARRWRKRYRGRTYYLRTPVAGKKDRQGYLDALAEWERLKAFLDGLGPNPYTPTGVLIPPDRLQSIGVGLPDPTPVAPVPLVESPSDPPWILSRGIAAALHPELQVGSETPDLPEKRVSALVSAYADHRRAEAEAGNISLKQYDEDRRQAESFHAFLQVNYPTLVSVDQITPAILNLYRDRQTQLCQSKLTLKKRLGGVRKWLLWLVDQNVLRELPKDMTTYAKVRMPKPKPQFFTPDELQAVYAKAPDLLRACILLGLNAGFTQQDCATLTAEMIDWQTGILTRDRNKTGVEQQAKLWPETLALLRKVGQKSGLLLLTPHGKPLVTEVVNPRNLKVVKVDHVQKEWHKLKVSGKTFKHLRKTAANYIESWNPSLTGLFLAHAERGTKRHYVAQHFRQLFSLTDRLRDALSTVWNPTKAVA